MNLTAEDKLNRLFQKEKARRDAMNGVMLDSWKWKMNNVEQRITLLLRRKPWWLPQRVWNRVIQSLLIVHLGPLEFPNKEKLL